MNSIENTFQEFIDAIQTAGDANAFERIATRLAEKLGFQRFAYLRLSGNEPMERLLVTPLSRFRQGTPIRLSEGILFATYATLRTDERGEKLSRVRQIVEWLGSDFDGVIVFDESHAMPRP